MNVAEAARRARIDRLPVLGGALRRMGRVLNIALHGNRGVPALIDGEVPLRLSPTVFSGGVYGFDPNLMRELKSLAASGGDFVDAGAHVGIASLLYAHFAGDGPRILSFEPNPAVFPLLVDNAAVNAQRFQPLPFALGDRIAEAQLYCDAGNPNASLSADAPGEYWYWKDRAKPAMSAHRVFVTTLDAICNAIDLRPKVVKVDVEGAELHMLRGSERILREVRPVILLETHMFAWPSFGYSGGDLQRFIEDRGYDIVRSDGGPLVEPLGVGPEPDNNHYILVPR